MQNRRWSRSHRFPSSSIASPPHPTPILPARFPFRWSSRAVIALKNTYCVDALTQVACSSVRGSIALNLFDTTEGETDSRRARFFLRFPLAALCDLTHASGAAAARLPLNARSRTLGEPVGARCAMRREQNKPQSEHGIGLLMALPFCVFLRFEVSGNYTRVTEESAFAQSPFFVLCVTSFKGLVRVLCIVRACGAMNYLANRRRMYRSCE